MHFFAPQEHYRLLAVLARQVHEAGLGIVDVGSPALHSAAALWVGAHKVETFEHEPDKKKVLPPAVEASAKKSGILVRTEDPLRALTSKVLERVGLIALDVEPHSGVYERVFLQALLDRGYRGLVVLDESQLNAGMRDVLKWAPVRKIDVTHLAHWSGTALLVFDAERFVVDVESPPRT
jgi:hypothetical protein